MKQTSIASSLCYFKYAHPINHSQPYIFNLELHVRKGPIGQPVQ